MDNKVLYWMGLHDTKKLHNCAEIMRVPGGWIYSQWDSNQDNSGINQVFVPFNNEFMDKGEK